MKIKRDLYLQRLINRIDNGMIKVITGIRRSGKSYLIFKIFKSYLLNNLTDEQHIIEFELDRICLLYTSPSPRDSTSSRMPSSA